MLLGVLKMPPELWQNTPIDVAQRHGRYLQAASEIERLEAENTKLREDAARLDWLEGEGAGQLDYADRERIDAARKL